MATAASQPEPPKKVKFLDDNPASRQYNVLVVGDSGVGKSSVVRRYVDGFVTLDSVEPTTGYDYEETHTKIDSRLIKVRIWDTSGDPKFHNQNQHHYKNQNLDGVVLVFDLTNRESFKNVQKWIKELDLENNDTVSTMLVGNKTDLETEIAVKSFEGHDIANSDAVAPIVGYWEVSAKTGAKVKEAFLKLVEVMYNEKEYPENVFTCYGSLP